MDIKYEEKVLVSKIVETYRMEMIQTEVVTHSNGSTTIRGYVAIDGRPEWEFMQRGKLRRTRGYQTGCTWSEWK